MFNNLKLRSKLMIIGCFLTIAPLIIIGIVMFSQNKQVSKISGEESLKLAYTDLEHIVSGAYNMVETQHELLSKMIRSYQNFALDVVKTHGGARLSSETVKWNAVNQFTNRAATINVPKFLVGSQWLGQIRNPKKTVFIVDHIQTMAPGMFCTVYQKINNNGDMLRVASNVMGQDGNRSIGTYLPAVNRNGEPVAMISSVLRGQTYLSRVQFDNTWYMASYEPLFDADRNIIGAIAVGTPLESAKHLRESIMDVKVGSTGYIAVFNTPGNYIVSYKGTRDGENILDAQNSKGEYTIQEMIKGAKALKTSEYFRYEYDWQNPGDPKPRKKLSISMYFEPWDWVISATTYEEEFLAGTLTIQEAGKKSNTFLLWVVVISLLAAIVIWFLTSLGIAGPVTRIAEVVRTIAEKRDLTLTVPVSGRDEIGMMAKELNAMMAVLKNTFTSINTAAKTLDSHSEDVAQRASANIKRAESQKFKMGKVQGTVKEMGKTAGKVAEDSNAQKEAAESSNKSIVTLLDNMKNVRDSAGDQLNEAQIASERVGKMGETGAQVVETAGKQGEAVITITKTMDDISVAATEMTDAATQSLDYGKQVLLAAEDGAVSVEKTVDGMKAISESSTQITEIITVITEIAEQTNLLSLNAAIEAARAGVHGKGFAVVANEVGKLAQRSSEAAKEITQLIQDSADRVAEGTELADASRNALQKISQGGKINMESIEGISDTTQKLSVGITLAHDMILELNAFAKEIENMAGQQGQRRKDAQQALSILVDKSKIIAELIQNADSSANAISNEMNSVVHRTEEMNKLTSLQATRSGKLTEITSESANAAEQTVVGAGHVVTITGELKSLSDALVKQIDQFRIQ